MSAARVVVMSLAFGTGVLAARGARADEPFYLPVGDLLPGSGTGLADATVYAPGMRYPLEVGPSYPNSQVYMNGGSMGPGGGQCDAVNYSYPWRDNYCETRSWDMPLRPAGQGHQGQDIRGPTCENKVHQIVATTDGTITNVGSYSVYLTTPAGQRFDYLHGALDTLSVSTGQAVVRGAPIVKLSNNMGDTPTTIHLHFNIKQDIGGVGFVYVSPYMSLVQAYETLMGLGDEPPAGAFEQAACTALTGWAQDPDTPDAPVTVDVLFGGPKGDPAAVPVQTIADVPRPDLCMAIGSCDHGFALEVPVSLRDDQPHPIFAYANDSEAGEAAELALSPGQIQCAPPPIPAGVRRPIAGPESLAAWKLSPFWLAIRATDPQLEAIPPGRDLGAAPLLVVDAIDAGEVWLLDQGFRRLVADPTVAAAWGFDLGNVETWASADLQGLPEGPPVRASPVLVQGSGPALYLIDDALCEPAAVGVDPLCPAASGDSSSEDGEAGPASASEGGPTNTNDADSSDATHGGGHALPDGYGQDDGCGCDQRPGAAGLAGLVMVLLGLRRRRQ